MSNKMIEENKALIQAYGRYRNTLCSRYDRMCISNGCPMSKMDCYDFHSVAQMFTECNPRKRARILKELKRLAKQEGVELP